MTNPKISFSALLIVCSCVLCAWVQAAPASGPRVRLLAFGFDGEARALTVSDSTGKAVLDKPVPLSMYQCSASVAVPVRNLLFTPVGTDSLPAGKACPLQLPASGEEFVLVFLPLPASKGGGYMVHAVELPSSRFKSGGYAFLNYTDVEILCSMEKENIVIVPTKAGIMSPKIDEGIVRVMCYERKAGVVGERPFFSGRMVVQKGVRNLVLCARDPGSGQIEFRGVPEFLGKIKAERRDRNVLS